MAFKLSCIWLFLISIWTMPSPCQWGQTLIMLTWIIYERGYNFASFRRWNNNIDWNSNLGYREKINNFWYSIVNIVWETCIFDILLSFGLHLPWNIMILRIVSLIMIYSGVYYILNLNFWNFVWSQLFLVVYLVGC